MIPSYKLCLCSKSGICISNGKHCPCKQPCSPSFYKWNWRIVDRGLDLLMSCTSIIPASTLSVTSSLMTYIFLFVFFLRRNAKYRQITRILCRWRELQTFYTKFVLTVRNAKFGSSKGLLPPSEKSDLSHHGLWQNICYKIIITPLSLAEDGWYLCDI